jgi:hypothetical protein
MVVSVHRRCLAADAAVVGELIDGLGTPGDRLWPADRWPAMLFAGPPEPGAAGGHGPIRYDVQWREQGAAVWFRFRAPPGFGGGHGFFAHRLEDGTLLEHRLEMETSGWARITWPFVYGPLHRALIEDALSRAAAAVGERGEAPRWSLWVRLLRRLAGRFGRRSR